MLFEVEESWDAKNDDTFSKISDQLFYEVKKFIIFDPNSLGEDLFA